MTKIKICGITNMDDARAAVNLGADALGFVFYNKSKRYIDPKEASRIAEALPPFVKKVGVFSNEEEKIVNEIKAAVNLDLLQIHGDEDPEYCGRLNGPYIKAFRIKDKSTLDEVNSYQTETLKYITSPALDRGIYVRRGAQLG